MFLLSQVLTVFSDISFKHNETVPTTITCQIKFAKVMNFISKAASYSVFAFLNSRNDFGNVII